jgi:hypothetical protein
MLRASHSDSYSSVILAYRSSPVWVKPLCFDNGEKLGKVKAKWGLLTDDDLMTIKGSRELFVGKIQERYGRTLIREAGMSAKCHKRTLDPGLA